MLGFDGKCQQLPSALPRYWPVKIWLWVVPVRCRVQRVLWTDMVSLASQRSWQMAARVFGDTQSGDRGAPRTRLIFALTQDVDQENSVGAPNVAHNWIGVADTRRFFFLKDE